MYKRPCLVFATLRTGSRQRVILNATYTLSWPDLMTTPESNEPPITDDNQRDSQESKSHRPSIRECRDSERSTKQPLEACLVEIDRLVERDLRDLSSLDDLHNFYRSMLRSLRKVTGARIARFEKPASADSDRMVDLRVGDDRTTDHGVDYPLSPTGQDDAVVSLHYGEDQLGDLPQTAAFIRPFVQQIRLAERIVSLASEEIQKATDKWKELTANQRVYELARANEVLVDALQRIVREIDVQPTIDRTMRQISQQFDARLVEYWRYDFRTGQVRPRRVYCDDRVIEAEALGHPAAQGIPVPATLAEAADHPRRRFRAYVSNLAEQGDVSDKVINYYRDGFGCEDFVHLPVAADGKLVAAFISVFPAGHQYQRTSVEIAHALVNQCALAIHIKRIAGESVKLAVAQQNDRTRLKRITEMNMERGILSRTAQQLSSDEPIEPFFHSLLSEAVEYLGADAAMLYLHDRDQDLHQWVVEFDTKDESVSPESSRPPRQTAASICPAWQHVLETRSPVRSSFAEVDKERFAQFVEHHENRGHRSFAAAPLLSGNNVMGNLLICSTQTSAATASQLGFLQTLAQQAMVALRMNDLVDEARQSAISKERNLMAREIHDTLAQNFVGVLMQMEAAEEAKTLAPDQVAAFHDRVRLLAKEGILQARKAVYTFGQPSDDRTPIDESTRQILRRFCDGTRIDYKVNTHGDVGRITPNQNAQLRSILVEAIVNAVKHGSAKSLQVNFECEGQKWQVSVVDDGCGMDVSKYNASDDPVNEKESKSLANGLSNIRARVQSIGGELHIESSPGLGTTIKIIGPQS